jgi:hypothetical protein
MTAPDARPGLGLFAEGRKLGRATSFLAKGALGSALLVSALLAPACTHEDQMGGAALGVVGQGVINDPANKSLRFDILRFGLEKFCEEMMARGAPLKLHDDDPVMGRFYADSCQSQVLDAQNRNTLVVQFGGRGYAWTNLTGRIGFRTRGLVELSPDFRLKDDTLYVYFRTDKVDASEFALTLVESPTATAALQASGVSPEQVGRSLVDAQLRRGFTVIRYDEEGLTDFELGLVPVGTRPFRPFTVVQSSKSTLGNGRTEVQANQQDFIGRFDVTDDDQALSLTMKLDGAAAVDVAILPARNMPQVLDQFLSVPGPAPLSTQPNYVAQLTSSALLKAEVPLPEGQYFLVIDHSTALGTAAPTGTSAAKVDYLVQRGDAP